MSEPVTEYFSDRVEDYTRFRPGYAAEALKHILAGLPARPRIADVGCGTGIMTRALLEVGGGSVQVLGVEPNEEMRAAAVAASSKDLTFHGGTAEATGLEANTFDLVVCAQAFHWFDAARALAEFQRLLRPTGRLALVWNVRGAAPTPFNASYEGVVIRARAAAGQSGRKVCSGRTADPTLGGRFSNVRLHSFPNPHPMTWDELRGRIQSASYFPSRDPLRVELLTELREAFDTHQVHGRIVLGQATEVTLADRT